MEKFKFFFFFRDEISVDSVNGLVQKLQAEAGPISLWFSTNGGTSSAMEFLMTYLNSRAEEITITLTDKIYSAGTQILTDFNGTIEIKELDSILFHVADRETYNFRKDSYSADFKIISKQDRAYNLRCAAKFKQRNLLTDKQIKDFLKGKDVVIYQEQFLKYNLNYSEKIF